MTQEFRKAVLAAAVEITGHSEIALVSESFDAEEFTIHDCFGFEPTPDALRPPPVGALVDAQIRARALEILNAPAPYRQRRSEAYRDELGPEAGDYIRTIGDVLDILIAEVASKGPPFSPAFAQLLAKVQAIKARIPKP